MSLIVNGTSPTDIRCNGAFVYKVTFKDTKSGRTEDVWGKPRVKFIFDAPLMEDLLVSCSIYETVIPAGTTEIEELPDTVCGTGGLIITIKSYQEIAEYDSNWSNRTKGYSCVLALGSDYYDIHIGYKEGITEQIDYKFVITNSVSDSTRSILNPDSSLVTVSSNIANFQWWKDMTPLMLDEYSYPNSIEYVLQNTLIYSEKQDKAALLRVYMNSAETNQSFIYADGHNISGHAQPYPPAASPILRTGYTYSSEFVSDDVETITIGQGTVFRETCPYDLAAGYDKSQRWNISCTMPIYYYGFIIEGRT